MDRLIAPNSVIAAQADTAPATGTPQFATDGNPATNVPATQWPAYQYNAIQEELIAVLTAAGITPDRTSNAQISAAIKRLGQKTVVLADTGAVNAYTAVNATPLVAGTWVDGVVQAVKIAHTNTGASTYAPDGLTAIPIYGLGLQSLQGGELLLNGTAILMHATVAGVNGGNPICVLMECAGGAQQVAPATQSEHAAQLQQIGHGQCRLVIGGGTALSLSPFGGNNLIINGVPQQIPSAGVTVSNSGLAASTVYFVYAAMSGGAMVLNFSTTGHSTAANGVETKTGDTTQTLVGMIRTNSSSQFISTAAAIGLINWFNRQLIPLLSSNSVNSTTSTSFVNVGPSVTFITWANSSIPFFLNGYGFNSTAADGVSAQIGLDATTGLSTISNLVSPTANASSGLNVILSSAVTEGFHTIAGYGCALTGGNANFVLSLSGAIYG